MLGVVHDFMAFVSKRFRKHIQSRRIIRADRIILRKEITRLSQIQPFVGYHIMTQIFLAITEAIRPPLTRTRFPLTPPTKLSRTMYRVEPTHADEISDNPDLSDIKTDSSMDKEIAKTIMDAVDCYSEKPAESTPDTHYRQKTKVRHQSEPVNTGGREYRERSNVLSFPKSPVPNTPVSYRSSRERIEAEAASAKARQAMSATSAKPATTAETLADTLFGDVDPSHWTLTDHPHPRTQLEERDRATSTCSTYRN